MRLCICSIFDEESGRPLITGLRNSKSGATTLFELYISGTGKSIFDINKNEKTINDIIMGAQSSGITIVTSDWKSHVAHFKLPLCKAKYDAYDLQLSHVKVSGRHRARKVVEAVLERMCSVNIYDWQRVLADASIAYQDMENCGVIHGGLPRFPKWSQRTSTGRSKCKGFNLQGIKRTTREYIRSANGFDDDVLILFDWISADMRFAGIFSGDEDLNGSFVNSDPYTRLSSGLGLSGEAGARDECKIALLKSINSMNVDGVVFSVYPRLGDWITKCRSKLSSNSGYLDTFLGRRFRISGDSGKLKVLNGVMQGSVAHAMQLVVRRVWELIGGRLLAEIHDSLVMSCPVDMVDQVIATVAPIMLCPFSELFEAGVVDTNPDFPFKVYVGPSWHGWELYETHRINNIERVSSVKSQKEPVANITGEEEKVEAESPSSGVGEKNGRELITTRSEVNKWFGSTRSSI